MIDVLDILRAKRDGHVLTATQIQTFIRGCSDGSIGDGQVAAMLMAVVWRGLNEEELAVWTAAMTDSGRRLDLSHLSRPTVDKHSTGGVGDKVSLVLVPLVAACGAVVPQLSGRGLGHTGGTLDKLESIPGLRTDLGSARFTEVLDTVGCAIAAADDDLCPADRRLYALRDVTATVESIPLITSSILSKKLAEGTDGLVLDVKLGSGSFLRDDAATRRLAETMVEVGNRSGVATIAVLSDMDQPLGRTVGNALEVVEAIEVLRGAGPADVRALTIRLAEEMLSVAGIDADPGEALDDGRAMARFAAMVEAQGGDPTAPLPAARTVTEVRSERSGIVGHIDCRAVGIAVWRLGAGRSRLGDPVSPSAGARLHVGVGDDVRAGDVLVELHADDSGSLDHGRAALTGAFDITERAPAPRPLIADRIGPRDVRAHPGGG